MEKLTLIGNQLVSISHQFQCGLPWISPVEEVAKVFGSLLEVF
jgi:hypothetical protein